LSFLFPQYLCKCCFTVPRSEKDLVWFTVTWNKAIGKKLEAVGASALRTSWPYAQLSVEGLPCRFEMVFVLPLPTPQQTLQGLLGEVGSPGSVENSKGRDQIRIMEEGSRFEMRGKILKT
jgi:hypothetical protein